MNETELIADLRKQVKEWKDNDAESQNWAGKLNAENGILSEQKTVYIRQQQAHVRQHKAMLATLDIFRDQMDEIACCDNMVVVMHMLRTLVENFSQWLIDRQKGKEYV